MTSRKDWIATVLAAVDELPTTVNAAAAVDDGGDHLTVVGVEAGEPDTALLSQLDQMLASPRTVAALATRTRWSPTWEGESSDAWAVAVVVKGHRAFFGVRRLIDNDQWWNLQPEHVPWFLLSTAGGLRSALERGKPLTLKRAENESVLRTPAQVPAPPVDRKGRL